MPLRWWVPCDVFHLGSIWRVNEFGYLPRFERVSSVSGGSITAGLLALWQPCPPGCHFRDPEIGDRPTAEPRAELVGNSSKERFAPTRLGGDRHASGAAPPIPCR
jgi:hypothetical protein